MSTKDFKFVEKHQEYVDTFQIFSRHRGKQQAVWVENKLVERLRDVLQRDYFSRTTEFKVLAFGTNVGSFDTLLIKALFSHAKELVEGKQVTYTVIEPNTVAIDEFKRNISTQGGVFQNIKFNWINKRMEEFLETKGPERYDLIQFVHVLYYAENEEELLKTAYEKFLASPGCILAVCAAEGNIWRLLVESFKLKIPSLIVNQVKNVELSEICKRNQWEHRIFDAKMDLEVTDIFNEGDPIGKAMLLFFLHVDEEPKEKLGKEIILEVMEFLKRMSWEKIKDGKKRLFVNEDDGILLIYKRS